MRRVLRAIDELAARTGGMIIAPGRTMRSVLHDGKGGFRDLAALLLLQALANEFEAIARGVLDLVDLGVFDGLFSIVNAIARTMVIPFLVAALASLLLGLQRRPQHALQAFDLACLCAIPGVVLESITRLTLRLGGVPLVPSVTLGMRVALALSFVVLILWAMRILREDSGHAAKQ
jgi:hypothetical protein